MEEEGAASAKTISRNEFGCHRTSVKTNLLCDGQDAEDYWNCSIRRVRN
jgi:hypothetical protein